MSESDVHGYEMNDPHDFDDATADALLSGSGRAVDAGLADLLGDMRVAYTSTPPVIGAELSALMGATQPVPAQSFISRRFEQMRSSMLAKIGVGAAVFAAATGSLAVAHALPAPVQNAVSHLGVGTPSHHHGNSGHHGHSALLEESTTTTTVDLTAPTDPTGGTGATGEPSDNHGAAVSSVAQDHSTVGCEHGAAVSNVASGGKSNNDAPCETTTTVAGGTTPTSVDDNQGGDNQGADNQSGDNQGNGGQGDTPTTTVAPGTTPTTEVHDGASNKSSGDGGDSNSSDTSSSGGDSGGGSGSGGGDGSGASGAGGSSGGD